MVHIRSEMNSDIEKRIESMLRIFEQVDAKLNRLTEPHPNHAQEFPSTRVPTRTPTDSNPRTDPRTYPSTHLNPILNPKPTRIPSQTADFFLRRNSDTRYERIKEIVVALQAYKLHIKRVLKRNINFIVEPAGLCCLLVSKL